MFEGCIENPMQVLGEHLEEILVTVESAQNKFREQKVCPPIDIINEKIIRILPWGRSRFEVKRRLG